MSYNEQETRFFLIDPLLRTKGYDDYQRIRMETPAPVEPTGQKGGGAKGRITTDNPAAKISDLTVDIRRFHSKPRHGDDECNGNFRQSCTHYTCNKDSSNQTSTYSRANRKRLLGEQLVIVVQRVHKCTVTSCLIAIQHSELLGCGNTGSGSARCT